MKTTKTCTQEGVTPRQPMTSVCVSHVHGTNEHVLLVSRHYADLANEWGGRGRFKRCDHDGRTFASSDEAWAFALDRGYVRPFFMPLDWRARRVCMKERALQLKSRERTLEWLAGKKQGDSTASLRLASLRKGAWLDWHRREYASRLAPSVGYVRGRYANWLRRAIREHLIAAPQPA